MSMINETENRGSWLNDEQIELTTTVCESIDEYVKDNAMDMQSSTFVSDMYSEVTELMVDTWKEGDICNDDDYDDWEYGAEPLYESKNYNK